MLKEKILVSVGSFKAAMMWMHAAHHLTKGPSFVATHELLYGRIYQTILEDFDKLIEKLVYQMDDEDYACPVLISSIAAEVLKQYDTPANLDFKNISMLSLVLIVDHMQGLEQMRELFINEDILSLGMDDFLSSAINQYETYAYMINQQLKE